MNENYFIDEQNRVIRWRNLIIKINIAACVTLFLIEIGMFSMIYNTFLPGEIKPYLFKYIVIPMSISISSTLICIFFEHWEKGHRPNDHLVTFRNFYPIFTNWAIVFVVSYYHYIFVMTMLLFALSLVLTVFFLERKITIAIADLSYLAVIVSALYSKNVSKNEYIHEYLILNVVIAIVFITFIGCLCIFLINLIKSKNDDMEQSIALARNANKAKTNFLSNMSREIRTPINAIIGMNEVILRESKEQRFLDCANDIETAANSLLGLIDEMYNMSIIESGKLEISPEEYSVEQLVYVAIHFVQKRAILKRINFESDISAELPSKLFGDDKRIIQVITVMLENAVKYTSEGTVTLKVDGFVRNDEYVLQVAVKDTGTGLRQEEIDGIFLSFERLGLDKNDNVDGTGLGLAISNRLLTMMGARLSVISEVGSGSTFSFKVTQKIIDSTPIGEYVYRDNNLISNKKTEITLYAPKANVLVVDDNELNLKVFKGLLLPSAMNIDEAVNGYDAIKLCCENHYDIIFLDHLMPGMDGIETLKHIREDSGSINRLVPVVMLTANAASGAREEFLEKGFDDFLLKPIVTNKLIDTINNLIDPELIEERPQNFAMPSDDDMDDFVFPSIQGVDWEKGITNCGTKTLLIDTIKQFCNVVDDEIAYLDSTVKYDREKYRIKVHSIKSVAATIGSDTICVLARILEFAARDGKTDVIDRVHAVLIAEMKSYKSEIEKILPQEEAKQTGDVNIVAMELNNIKSAMMELDTDRADAAMERINEFSYDDEIQPLVDRLANAVNNLDEDAAIEVCDILEEKLFNTDLEE